MSGLIHHNHVVDRDHGFKQLVLGNTIILVWCDVGHKNIRTILNFYLENVALLLIFHRHGELEVGAIQDYWP